jgi:Thrombospondin type 3 repeat
MRSLLAERRQRVLCWAGLSAALVIVTVLLIAARAGASMPYNPLFELVSISNSAPSANANVTFRTSLPAGNHIFGLYGLETPDNWTVAGHSNQLTGDVTAIGTLQVNLEPDGNCNDGDSGSPQTYGPFPLRDQDPGGGGGPHAMWGGVITDFADGNPATSWGITLTIEQLDLGYTIDGFLTDAILPAGNTVCTPQIFTLTLCGRANPTPTATVCGSGSNEVVMTNPPSAACHFWRFVTTDESGQHSASRDVGVSIGGAACPTPTPTPATSPTPTAPPPGDSDGDGVSNAQDNCPNWWNPSQAMPPWTVGANDPDCDGFSSNVESPVGTNALRQCGFNSWPGDVNNDTFSDITDISALTANFGLSVPPAPARYNIAPSPVDTFVDITDISKMTSLFGFTCAPCQGDLDCDAVANAGDNCPNWSNPGQGLPSWPVPANDPDCDGFSTGVENSAGTSPSTHCGANSWPADIDNNTFSDITDISALTANFGSAVPPAPDRQDIAPDPVDNFVDITDISKMTQFFGLTCS